MMQTVILALAVGILIGMAFQRYQVCMASIFRNYISFGKKEKVVMLLTMVILSAIVFNFLIGMKLIVPATKSLMPVSLAGGIFLGFGMVLSGSCVAGTLFRIGEGNLSALITFLGMVFGLFLVGATIATRAKVKAPHFIHTTMLDTLKINPLYVSIGIVVLCVLAFIWWKVGQTKTDQVQDGSEQD